VRPFSFPERAAWLLGLFAAYLATAKLGLALDPVGGFATLVWPPTGIALAALVRRGPALWPAVALGALVANLTSGAPWPVAAGIAFGNTLEALLGARVLSAVADHQGPIVRVRHAVALLVAALLGPLVSASIGVLSLRAGGVPMTAHGLGVWQAWWLGDVLGALVVAPVLLNLGAPHALGTPARARVLESLGLIAAVLALATLSFSGDPSAPLRRPHMIFPALIWAAIRFSTWISSLIVLMISCVAIIITLRGTGPYVAGTSLHENLTALQGFMGTVALTSLFLAAANTERAAAQRALEKDEQALRAALGMRDEFLSIASHELRTPLAALSLQVAGLERALSKRNAVSEESRRELHRAGRAVAHVERLARIVDNLFDVSQISAGQLQLARERVDLCEVVRTVESGLSEQATRAGCSVSSSLPAAVTGYWDRFRIEQVITNLLTNAFKYGAGKPVEVSVEATDTVARLRVRDHGTGIAPEVVEQIFERFERFASGHHQKSLGVGLYIARQIIDAHAGVVRVEETSASGSTFLVELPRTAEPAPSSSAPAALTPS
jgi:signal transduction histidine kinase